MSLCIPIGVTIIIGRQSPSRYMMGMLKSEQLT